jgi:parallel beta-helix repeat protein
VLSFRFVFVRLVTKLHEDRVIILDRYSRLGNVVRGNIIANNAWAGIAIDHGQDFIIENNTFSRNGNASSAGSSPPWVPYDILVRAGLLPGFFPDLIDGARI